WRTPAPSPQVLERRASSTPKTSTVDRLLWFLLPACGSVLLLAVTNKICQDISVMPLLWILPLALYLLSFVLCFERPRFYARAWLGPALFVCLSVTAWLLAGRVALSAPVQIGVYCLGLFVCCLVLHGELYRLRPGPTRLTSFYLNLAAGGAAGGFFVAVAA